MKSFMHIFFSLKLHLVLQCDFFLVIKGIYNPYLLILLHNRKDKFEILLIPIQLNKLSTAFLTDSWKNKLDKCLNGSLFNK